MLTVEGIYQNGKVKLDSAPLVDLPTKVIVSFPDIESDNTIQPSLAPLNWDNFSFDESRDLLRDLKSSLSEAVIQERRNS